MEYEMKDGILKRQDGIYKPTHESVGRYRKIYFEKIETLREIIKRVLIEGTTKPKTSYFYPEEIRFDKNIGIFIENA